MFGQPWEEVCADEDVRHALQRHLFEYAKSESIDVTLLLVVLSMSTRTKIDQPPIIKVLRVLAVSLKHYEVPRRLLICPEVWESDTEDQPGLLTETKKLKRRAIESKFEAEIAEMFADELAEGK